MKQSFPGRKDSIILAAIDIINDSGIQNLSTKELAKRQDITESLLYRHFRSKDEIIIGVLEYYSRFDEAIKNTVRKSGLPSKEKLIEYFRMYVEYYENYPAITSIQLSYHQLLKDSNTAELVGEIFNRRDCFVLELVKQCREDGIIGNTFSPEEITSILLGFSREIISRWRKENFTFSLKENILTTLKKILEKV